MIVKFPPQMYYVIPYLQVNGFKTMLNGLLMDC